MYYVYQELLDEGIRRYFDGQDCTATKYLQDIEKSKGISFKPKPSLKMRASVCNFTIV